jgi:hypothetical protein
MRAFANVAMNSELHEKLAFGLVDDKRTFLELLLDVYPPSTMNSLYYAAVTLSKVLMTPTVAARALKLDFIAGIIDLLAQKDKDIVTTMVSVFSILLASNGTLNHLRCS